MSEALQAKPTLITEAKLPSCGNCHFAKFIQLGQVECWGAPPTPAVLGGRPTLGGQVEFNIELLRPRLASNTAGCALHRFKDGPSVLDVAQGAA